ncbi:MAG TPA: Fe(2+)-trafficking protein [Chthonomonadaceae bacterium]|nr:Fe(2+)-trafficking protein [Chthonomonadaceae bacterium]
MNSAARKVERAAVACGGRDGRREKECAVATITCVRCGKSAEAMPEPPMGGQLGATVQEKVCPSCYADWIDQQVLLINHYGLQMADPDDRKKLIQAMKDFLGLAPA